MTAGKDAALEALMTQLGEFGPYQLRQHLLHLLTAFLAGIHMLSLTFTAPEPEHRCEVPDIDFYKNNTDLSGYIPYDSEKDGFDSCMIYKIPGDPNGGTIPCNGPYVFDTTYYTTSRVIDFGLVCDKRWMRALLQSIYMVGVLCGAVTLGSLADSYGRKPILYISAVLQLVFGLACAFVPDFYSLAAVMFFYGAFGSGGAYVTGFVLSMELIGASKRTICGTAFSFVFAVGIMLVAFWGWLLPSEWKGLQLLQIIFACHSLFMIGHWWLVDESIRWLWGKGRTKEALEIASRAIEINGKYYVRRDQKNGENDPEAQNQSENTEPEVNADTGVSIIGCTPSQPPMNHQQASSNAGMVDLFRYPNLRFRAITMAYNWFANSLVYYGLSFTAGTLPGNPYLMSFLTGLAEVPGYLIVVLLLDRLGRRCLGSLLLFLGGFAMIVVAFFNHGLVVITIAMLAKVAVAGSFGICFNYTAELFPTVIRNSVVGITTMAARGAGMLAPEIILLDSVGKSLPTVIFGAVAIFAAFFGLFLPETLNKEMPQTIEDGEHFGKGDTAFRTFWRFFKRRRNQNDNRERLE